MNLPTGAKTTSIASGPNLPAECRPEAANVFFKTTHPVGMHQCLTEGEWSEIAGGEGGVTSLTEHQIGFGSASNTVTGDEGFTFDPSILSPVTDDFLTVLDINVAGITADPMGSYPAFQGARIKFASVDSDLAQISGLLLNLDTASTVTGADFQGLSVLVTNSASASGSSLIGAAFGVTSSGGDQAIGLTATASGATNNYAIKTAAGDIVLGVLSGTGSRAVVADANGKLSAP